MSEKEKTINEFIKFCIKNKVHFCKLNLKSPFEGDFEAINEFKLVDQFLGKKDC